MKPPFAPCTTARARRGACSALLAALLIPTLGARLLAADADDRLRHLSIEELGSVKVDSVFTASKFMEKVTDAPSSVTIVTRDEISKFGYRTMADIMRATRGYDVTYDRDYAHAGVRGFTSLSDYGSRTLLLVGANAPDTAHLADTCRAVLRDRLDSQTRLLQPGGCPAETVG